MSAAGKDSAVSKMRAAEIDERAIRVFEHYYDLVDSGVSGTISEASIEPLRDVETLTHLRFTHEEEQDALRKVAVVKLNGGLGTGMGLSGPKSALTVTHGLTFLDITIRQILDLRARYDAPLPLILMNSFRTREESLAILGAYPDLPVEGIQQDFVQNAEPKLRRDDLTPVTWPSDPSLEWCPPGHGDVYLALQSSGLLAALRAKGVRYVFLSNGDNLGATCDPQIAAWMVHNEIPYVAEVCERTPSDRKGGHLARRRTDGRIILRDNAQISPGEESAFQDITVHTMFHANNLWVDLDVLDQLLTARDGVLGLPILVNEKTVDPTDRTSTEVVQLETAMGTAIETFEGSRALLVPRTRFRPVKTTNDLLVLRSDWFDLDEHTHIVARGHGHEPLVTLDHHYTAVPHFERRFPAGAPSLIECTSLTVTGDVTFGAGIRLVGDVTITADEPVTLPDGATLTGAVDAASLGGSA